MKVSQRALQRIKWKKLTGNGVCCNTSISIAVDVDVNFWVGHGVNAWNAGEVRARWCARSASGNGDVSTFWVPLRLVAGVDSKQLVSKKVVSSWKTAGNCAGPGVVVCNQICHSPMAPGKSTALKTLLVNLEPLAAGSIVICTVSTAIGHPYNDWSDAVWPWAKILLTLILSEIRRYAYTFQ
jgi:hypothetical protein